MTTVVPMNRRARPMPDATAIAQELHALTSDWLFQSVSPETQARMLAERGFTVRVAAGGPGLAQAAARTQ